MRALLVKDLLSLKSQAKFYLIFILVYGAISPLMDSINLPMAIFIMLGGMVPATVMAWEERANWERFALTMPVNRRMMVLEKYLLSGLAVTVGALLALALAAVTGQFSRDVLISVALLLSVVYLYAAIILPVFFKLGVEKARWLNFGMLFIPVFALSSGLEKLPSEVKARLAAIMQSYGPVLALALVAFALGVSYWISCRIYAAKEF